MTNLLKQAINCDDADRAARIILDALGIQSDELANNCLRKYWPTDRKQPARIIGDSDGFTRVTRRDVSLNCQS